MPKTLETLNATAIDPSQVGPDEIVAQLRAIRQYVPEYTQLQSAGRKSLTPSAALDPQFVTEAVLSLTESDVAQLAAGVKPADVQRDIDDAAKWDVVEKEARALFEGVAAANLVRRHRIGKAALRTYGICRQLALQKENANLVPRVDAMRRMKRLGKRAQTAPQPEPQPQAPVPQTTPKAKGEN